MLRGSSAESLLGALGGGLEANLTSLSKENLQHSLESWSALLCLSPECPESDCSLGDRRVDEVPRELSEGASLLRPETSVLLEVLRCKTPGTRGNLMYERPEAVLRPGKAASLEEAMGLWQRKLFIGWTETQGPRQGARQCREKHEWRGS